MSLFAGTSEFYRCYRSGVPESVASVLDQAAPIRRPRRLLDIGTGTGFVIQALADRFDEIIGVDTDPDLIGIAQRDFTSTPQRSTRFITAAAETFTAPNDWTADLVTICRTFHWLDRTLVLNRLDDLVAPDGVVAIFGDNSIWAANAPWKEEIKIILADFLGDQRRAGNGTYTRPTRSYRDDLHESPFTRIDQVQIPVRRQRDLDSVIGYLHSTSFAAPHLFGNRLEEFAQALRDRLPPLSSPAGTFIDDNQFDVLIARRPNTGN